MAGILRKLMRRRPAASGSAAMLRARLYGVPLAVDASRFAAFVREVESLSPDALTVEALSDAVPRSGARIDPVSGVAVVSVHGPTVNRAGAFDALCGLTSYDQIRAGIDEAVRDPDVKRIVLDIDSPGGEIAGLSDLAAFIREAREKKPIIAVANEHAFSAAYWIASQATEIVAPRLAMVGSIGVILRHVDLSGANEKLGVNPTNIIAGAKKADGSPDAPLSAGARADLQSIVDEAYAAFVADVALGRGLSEKAVRSTEAGVFLAAQALDLGLIDRVASVDAALDEEDEEERRKRKKKREDEDEEFEEDDFDDSDGDDDEESGDDTGDEEDPDDPEDSDPDEDESESDDEEDDDEEDEDEEEEDEKKSDARRRRRVRRKRRPVKGKAATRVSARKIEERMRSELKEIAAAAKSIGVPETEAIRLVVAGHDLQSARRVLFAQKAANETEIHNYAPEADAKPANPLVAAANRLQRRRA